MDIHPSEHEDVWYVIDKGYDDPVLKLDVKTKYILIFFGEKGDGYGELSSPTDIIAPSRESPDSVYVFDRFKNKINVYTNDFSFVRQITLNFKGVFAEAKRIEDRKILLSTSFGSKAYAILDLETSELEFPNRDTLYPFPIDGFNVPDAAYGELCVAISAIDTKRRKVFLANIEFDMVQSYSLGGEKISQIRGPDMINPSGTVDVDGYYARLESNVNRAYNFPAFVLNDFVIFGYSGQWMDPNIEIDSKWYRSKELIVFSAETALPVARIKLGDVLFSRAHMDNETGNLYILDINPDNDGGDIVYFNLVELLQTLP